MSTERARFVALLRGINVGGSASSGWPTCGACSRWWAEPMVGCTDVATYIQSGNVVFCSRQTKTPGLTAWIEKALSEAFRYASRVVKEVSEKAAYPEAAEYTSTP